MSLRIIAWEMPLAPQCSLSGLVGTHRIKLKKLSYLWWGASRGLHLISASSLSIRVLKKSLSLHIVKFVSSHCKTQCEDCFCVQTWRLNDSCFISSAFLLTTKSLKKKKNVLKTPKKTPQNPNLNTYRIALCLRQTYTFQSPINWVPPKLIID